MEIGLDSEEDASQLASLLEIIVRIDELSDAIFDDSDRLERSENELGKLLQALPEPQVDLRLTILEGLKLARGSLDLLRVVVADGIPIVPTVLPVLLRSALLGAGRVLFVLGPESPDERVANANMVLRQEADSFHRAYTRFADFEQLTALVPSAERIGTYERRRVDLMRGGRPKGEAAMLDAMADVIGDLLQGSELSLDEGSQVAKEHVRWIFHVYSGIAHGFAWPRLVPGTGSLPGHLIAELTITVSVAHLAFDATLRRLGSV